MKILLNNNDLNEALYGISNLGFVPTMGSLHKGHISLIKKSLKVCSKTIVSIFVNPSQFNNRKDYINYPRNDQRDLVILKKLKVDYVYMPKKRNIYDNTKKSKIRINKQDKILCAKYRKGHFEGVIDIMERLTTKIKPNKIFMGNKDFQQVYLVKKYIEKKFNSKIISCKTIRSFNKIALSSRNSLLTKMELVKVSKLAQDIIFLKKKLKKKQIFKEFMDNKKKELTKKYNINIEYFDLRKLSNLKKSSSVKDSKFFIAYYVNNVRLIDNF